VSGGRLGEPAASVAELSALTAPTLAGIERRRLQLWILAAVLLVVLVVALALLTVWLRLPTPSWLTAEALLTGLVVLVLLFAAYAIDKELRLRRLTQQLLDECVLASALTNRLHEVNTLLAAAKAMKEVLDLDGVLNIILDSALELLAGHDGSIMLVHGEDELRTVCTAGTSLARGARVRFGEGVAGSVAASREPVLITGALERDARHLVVQGARVPSSAISLPLVHHDALLGVLNINAAGGRTFTEHDLRALALFGDHAAGAIANARLFEEQRLLASQNLFQALHDPLTSLPNRVLLIDRLERALARRHRAGRTIGLLFLDIDDFKAVNDRFGHAGGDELLVAFAGRLRACLRAGDTVARFGGDEFAILVDELSSPRDAVITAERLLRQLAQPFAIADSEVALSASIGVAVEGAGGASAAELLRNADAAKGEAKQAGKGRVTEFRDRMQADGLKVLDLEVDLRGALERGEICGHFQPVVELRTGRVVAYEALARWHHPKRGLLPAASFIPLAASLGLLGAVDRKVLHQTCLAARALAARLSPGDAVPVHFNLALSRLREAGVVPEIAGILAESGVTGGQLVFEIAEEAVLRDSAGISARLADLKGLGVRLALDGFGTRYASLSQLQHFPFDTVKIDRVFIDGLGHDRAAHSLVQAIVRLADSLAIAVIAEGIERKAQADALLQLGCRYGQGWLLGAVQPLEQILEPAAEVTPAR
jgi:diguanylate cyclase (GGDEF)-like protein